MKKKIWFSGVLFLLLLALPVQAFSGTLNWGPDVLQIQPLNQAEQVYELVWNKMVVMRYRTMSQGLQARERAAVLWSRLNKLGSRLQEGEITVACWQGNYVVTLEGELLITVTENDFKANNSTGEGLARVWAANLKQARKNALKQWTPPLLKEPAEDILKADEPSEPKQAEETQRERQMLNLINKARAEAGVQPLELHLGLTEVARVKAREMIELDYFSHTSPTYGDPFTMLQNWGIRYGYAGENLAGNATVEGAQQSLMASPGHRQNILNPHYTHVGLGIVAGGPYGQMFVQLFISAV